MRARRSRSGFFARGSSLCGRIQGARALAGLALAFVLGCGQTVGSGVAATAAPGGDDAPVAEVAATPVQAQPLLKDLGPDYRRAMVLVLPADAVVEVDDYAVPRRDGVVELVGKVGEKHRLRVFKGAQNRDGIVVTLQESGASPALIDLNAPAASGGAGVAGIAGVEADAARPAETTAPRAGPIYSNDKSEFD